MLVKNVIRGNSVKFSSTFMNEDFEPIVPNEPTVKLNYKSNNAYIDVTLDMTLNAASNTWQATWVSSNADVGIVQWHISGGDGIDSVEDGEFRIYSNRANGGPGSS